MLTALSSLLFSQSCYGCDNLLITQEKLICFDCLSQMEKTAFHLSPTQNELFYRLAGRVPIAGATSLYFFDKKGRLQKLIKALKYQDAPQLGIRLGQLLGRELKDTVFVRDIETIIPVPLHRNKKIARGYNQAEFFARGLAESLGIEMNKKALIRKKATLTQTRKGAEARWENVGGAFACKAAPGRSVLLVDDVITTGSTLVACIHALLAAPVPPEEIFVASIGMARLG